MRSLFLFFSLKFIGKRHQYIAFQTDIFLFLVSFFAVIDVASCMGVDHGGQGRQVSPEFGAGGR